MTSVLPDLRGLATRTFYIALQKGFNASFYFTRSRFWSPATQPDALRPEPSKPYLYSSRIFRPAHAPKDEAKLPLVIEIHGGGFVINTPASDDAMARYLADSAGCLVISIDYRKSPQHVFPAAYEDVVELVLALIDDESLPVNKDKVVLGGGSAGGNLVLAAAQDARLKDRILGVIALYPVVDAVRSVKEKMAGRPDATVPDMLESGHDDLLNMYLGSQQAADSRLREDPRLSPGPYASRDDLPKHLFLIGAEHDLLCAEAEAMAERLAEGTAKENTARGWRADSIRWDKIENQVHGFDVFGSRGKAFEKARLAQKEELYRDMVDWLKEVFAIA